MELSFAASRSLPILALFPSTPTLIPCLVDLIYSACERQAARDAEKGCGPKETGGADFPSWPGERSCAKLVRLDPVIS